MRIDRAMVAQNKGRWLAWVITVILTLLPVSGFANPSTIEDILHALGPAPALGPADPPVTIVEFSDFQCSFCKKFWEATLPKLRGSFIDTGQARFVYRHFAILGNPSVRAAQASECAGEQGKFWEYHDQLFTADGVLPFTDSKLARYARAINLKVPAFNRCLGSGKYLKKVNGETAVAAFLGVRGTPTFFINGRLLVGAQPFDVFQSAVQEELKPRRRKPQK